MATPFPNLGQMLLGAMATLLLGGPCTATMLLALRLIERPFLDSGAWEWPTPLTSLDALASFMIAASFGSLIPSMGATLINTLLQERLQRTWRRDAWPVGTACGSVSGVLAIEMAGIVHAQLDLRIAIVLAGLLMGMLYWSIAIRPRRNRRIAQLQMIQAALSAQRKAE